MSDKYDLRKVLDEMKSIPGQYHETNKEIDPNADLAGVYRYIGAGVPFSVRLGKVQP